MSTIAMRLSESADHDDGRSVRDCSYCDMVPTVTVLHTGVVHYSTQLVVEIDVRITSGSVNFDPFAHFHFGCCQNNLNLFCVHCDVSKSLTVTLNGKPNGNTYRRGLLAGTTR